MIGNRLGWISLELIKKAELTAEEFAPVVVHSAEEGGFWSEVVALPGCYSQGETIEETITNTCEAIESHVEALKQEGEPVPEEDTIVGTFKFRIT